MLLHNITSNIIIVGEFVRVLNERVFFTSKPNVVYSINTVIRLRFCWIVNFSLVVSSFQSPFLTLKITLFITFNIVIHQRL